MRSNFKEINVTFSSKQLILKYSPNMKSKPSHIYNKNRRIQKDNMS